MEDDGAKARGFIDYLQSAGRLDQNGVRRALAALSQSREPLELILQELGLIEEGNLLDSLAGYLKVDRASDLRAASDAVDLDGLPLAFLKRSNLAAA